MLAIYARVSTQEQAEKGTSIETQICECIAKAAAAGFSEWEVFVDEGESAGELDRPALGELRSAVASGRVEAVIAYDPDRLSRKLAHQLLLAEEFHRYGARLLFIRSEPAATPEGNMLFQIQGVIAEYEREKIRERTSRGRLAVARKGKVLPMGAAPYGYVYDPVSGSLKVDPAEAETVRQIYHWYVVDGLTMRAIGERLARLGIPARKGGRWHVSSVSRILRSEVYIGRFYYNRRRTQFTEGRTPAGNRKRRTSPRGRDEWVALAVPAVVDDSLFGMAQVRCAKNRVRGRTPQGGHPLLKGILVCGNCGGRWQVWVHGRLKEYRCTNRYPRAFPGSGCQSPSLAVNFTDQMVWDEILRLLSSPPLVSEIARIYESCWHARLAAGQAGLERACLRLTKERQRLAWLFQQGLLGCEQVEEGMRQVDERLRAAVEEQNRLTKQADHLPAIKDSPGQAYLQSLAGLDDEGRSRLMRFLCPEAVIRFDGEAAVLALEGPIRVLRRFCIP